MGSRACSWQKVAHGCWEELTSITIMVPRVSYSIITKRELKKKESLKQNIRPHSLFTSLSALAVL